MTRIADIHYGPGCAVRACKSMAVQGRCYCADCAKSTGANPALKLRDTDWRERGTRRAIREIVAAQLEAMTKEGR